MKNSILLIILLIIILSQSAAQVTFRENVKKVENNVVVLEKPKPYDSIQDFRFHEELINYNQYVGLQLFLPPTSNPNFS